MVADAPPLHVTFTASAAVSLRQALDRLGRKEEVLPLVDDLALGPIDPGTFQERRQWMDDELGNEYDDWEEQIPVFWARVTTMRTPIVAWLSKWDARELCGFLELLWRVKDVPVSIVDVSDVSPSFSLIRSDVMIDRKLFERATLVTDPDRARCEAEWQRLRAENAPLRVMTERGLVSAPITHFDETIRSFITDVWQKCSKVGGNALSKLWADGYIQPGSDMLVFSRLLALMDDETIEGESSEEYWSAQSSRVRRRPAV